MHFIAALRRKLRKGGAVGPQRRADHSWIMADKQTQGSLLTPTELSAFCAQITMVLKAGIGIGEGVGVMLEDVKNLQSRETLTVIHEKVMGGAPFFKALEAVGVFPEYLINMTEIGEKTGKLDDVMDSLVAYYEREEAISQSIKSAVRYPMVMIAIMLLVIGVVVVRVLPVFNEVFRDLGSEMTGFARTVMDMGSSIGAYSMAFVIALAALVAAFLLIRGTSGGRARWQAFTAKFPLTRSFYSKIASGRFASAMSLMLSSGFDPDESLDMVYRLTDNPVVKNKIDICRTQLAEGFTFSDALVHAELFSGIYARMVTVGFKTGSIDTVMKKLAERYENDIDIRISGIISILEPTLVAVLSIIVGLILLSVMLPLMGVMSSIG